MIIQWGALYRCDTCGAQAPGKPPGEGAPLTRENWPYGVLPDGWADVSALLRFIDGRPAGHLCGRCQIMPTLGLLAVLNGGELYRAPEAWDDEAAGAVGALLERLRRSAAPVLEHDGQADEHPDPTRI